MSVNLVKKSLSDIVKNPTITLFLVLYFIIISIMMATMGYQSNMIIATTLALTSFLFVAIFISGWLKMIKEVALKKQEDENIEQEENNESKRSLSAVFLEGIGENVIPFIIAISIYMIFSFIFAYAALLISMKYFGNPQELIMNAQNSPNLAEYINGLSQDDLVKLYAFPLSFMISVILCMFTFMYYFPAIAFNSKNGIFLKPFVAIKDNFCFLFKHFGKSILIYLSLCIINAVVAIIKKAYLPSHVLIDILYIFYVVYFLSFSVMLICNYYGKNYSCNNGGDCLGENKSDGEAGEEN